MKRLLLSTVLLGLCVHMPLMAEEEECVFAVDVEDDTRDYNYCNQDSALNRLANGIVGGEVNSKDGSTDSAGFQPEVQTVEYLTTHKALSQRRFELLQQIAHQCPKGFIVRSERYSVGKGDSLDLNFDYKCQK